VTAKRAAGNRVGARRRNDELSTDSSACGTVEGVRGCYMRAGFDEARLVLEYAGLAEPGLHQPSPTGWPRGVFPSAFDIRRLVVAQPRVLKRRPDREAASPSH
jgi:hypothetical protein